MIPAQGFRFEEYQRKDHKDTDRDHFLDDLELEHIEGAAGGIASYFIGWHHQRVLQQGNAPADEDRWEQANVLELEMSVPGNRHKGVGCNEQ